MSSSAVPCHWKSTYRAASAKWLTANGKKAKLKPKRVWLREKEKDDNADTGKSTKINVSCSKKDSKGSAPYSTCTGKL